MVAPAVFGGIGIISVPGAVNFSQSVIVSGMLIGVFNDKADGCARTFARKYAGEQADLVRFLARRGRKTTLAGSPPVEFSLDYGFIDDDAGRAAVHHTAQSRAM